VSELLLNIDKIIDGVAIGNGEIPRSQRTYTNFAKYKPANGGSDGHVGLTKSLYRNDSIKYLFSDITNGVLSSLLPNIKLYKIFYPTDKKKGEFRLMMCQLLMEIPHRILSKIL